MNTNYIHDSMYDVRIGYNILYRLYLLYSVPILINMILLPMRRIMCIFLLFQRENFYFSSQIPTKKYILLSPPNHTTFGYILSGFRNKYCGQDTLFMIQGTFLFWITHPTLTKQLGALSNRYIFWVGQSQTIFSFHGNFPKKMFMCEKKLALVFIVSAQILYT